MKRFRHRACDCYSSTEFVARSVEPNPSAKRRPVTSAVSSDDILRVLRERGGTASRSTLSRALQAPSWTLARRLAALVDDGLVIRTSPGSYQLADETQVFSGTAAEIVDALKVSGAEGHLTGYDLLAVHGHQFVRAFPHLVYADPHGLEQVAFALSQAGFQPVPAGRSARNLVVHAPDVDRVVVLRGQPVTRMDRLGVRSTVGPPEKAWLDLLREARSGSMPISMNELGAMLASMLRAGIDTRLLGRLAREMGFADHVEAVVHPSSVSDAHRPELQQLAEGAIR